MRILSFGLSFFFFFPGTSVLNVADQGREPTFFQFIHKIGADMSTSMRPVTSEFGMQVLVASSR